MFSLSQGRALGRRRVLALGLDRIPGGRSIGPPSSSIGGSETPYLFHHPDLAPSAAQGGAGAFSRGNDPSIGDRERQARHWLVSALDNGVLVIKMPRKRQGEILAQKVFMCPVSLLMALKEAAEKEGVSDRRSSARR